MEPANKELGFLSVGLALVLGIASVATSLFFKIETDRKFQENLGATVYTTQLTDTINTFRQQVNSSTANLNTELAAVSTTALQASNTLNTTFNPTTIARGGLATTTAPGGDQLLIGNGTGYDLKTLTASSGVTITTTSNRISIATQGVDTTANFSWTGLHTFVQAIFTSSTFSTTTLKGPFINNASTSHNATNTFNGNVLSTGSQFPSGLISSTTTDSIAGVSTTKNILSVSIPGGVLGTANAVEALVNVSSTLEAVPCTACTISFNVQYGATSIGTTTIAWVTNPLNLIGLGRITLVGAGATNSQDIEFSMPFLRPNNISGGSGGSSSTIVYLTGNTSEDSSAAKTLILNVTTNGSITAGLTQYVVRKIQ